MADDWRDPAPLAGLAEGPPELHKPRRPPHVEYGRRAGADGPVVTTWPFTACDGPCCDDVSHEA